MKNILLVPLFAVILAGCSATTPTPTPTTAPVEELSEPGSPDMYTYNLTEQNDSGQTGTLTLSDTGTGGVTAVLSMTGGDFLDPQPAHIHVGHCPKPGAVEIPLTNVVDGQSTTELDMSIEDIMAASPELAVNVHKSVAEAGVYTACADIQ